MSARGSIGARGLSAAALLLASLWIASCDLVAGTNDETHTDVVAGTNDDTHTEARILMPDGATPAVGACFVIVPVEGTVVANTGEVDAKGLPVLGADARPADGVYAMTTRLGTLASWTDSVKVVAGRVALASSDTLAEAGSIAGVVLPQPQHDAQRIVVNVLGTDVWTNVSQDGRFVLPMLGSGVLRLKFATTLDDYVPLYRTVRLGVGQEYVFPDTLRLPYTGIPVVQGLKAANDSATGDILLSWNAATHAHLVDYVVYRDSAGSVEYSATPIAVTTTTTWRDTTAKSSLRVRSWRYRVAVRVSGSSTPGEWNEVVEVASVPPLLANLKSIVWTSLGAPGGSLVGFLDGRFAAAALEIGTDSVRLPVWTSPDGVSWTATGRSFALRRMGQTVVRVAGFGAGRLWCFGRSGIGDGIEVASTVDGVVWSVATIADSLWPGDAGLFAIGSSGRIALVAPGARSAVLVGDSTGSWHRVSVTGRVLGLDDSGIWTDAGLARPTRVDAATGRTTLTDLGTWAGGDSLVAVSAWKGSIMLQAGSRLWVREGDVWSPRETPVVNVLSVHRDRILVRDILGTVWRGQ